MSTAPVIEIRIPTILRQHAGGLSKVEATGSTVGELLADLAGKYPGIRTQVLTAEGQLHKFVNIYVNDDDVRYIGRLDAAVKDGDQVSILPAVAGGL